MGSIIKRDTVFQGKIRRKGLPVISQTFDTKQEAQNWLDDTEYKIRHGQYIDTRRADTTTFYELIDLYIEKRLPHLKSEIKDTYMLERLKREPMARLTLTKLTPAILVAYRDKQLADGKKGASVVRNLAVISAVINFGRKDLLIEMSNPVSSIRRPKSERGRDRRLSEEEQERLFHELADHNGADDREDGLNYRHGCKNEWVLPMVKFALETAMRRAEMLKMKWVDVDLERRVVKLFDTKNGDDRLVPLSTAAVQILRGLPREAWDKSDSVFCTTEPSVKKAFERARKRALLDDFRFHDLRHEATSRMASKLPNLVELSAVTGHKTLAMLGRYYHPRAEDLALKLG
jgi:integrase